MSLLLSTTTDIITISYQYYYESGLFRVASLERLVLLLELLRLLLEPRRGDASTLHII